MLLNKILVPRREVGNTIRFRRRKGTLAVLTDLAEAVAGWPSRPVEFYRALSVTQSLDHLHLHRGRIMDLRDGNAKGAEAIGAAIAARSIEKGITRVVFDRGGFLYHGRIRAIAEAARKAGLEF